MLGYLVDTPTREMHTLKKAEEVHMVELIPFKEIPKMDTFKDCPAMFYFISLKDEHISKAEALSCPSIDLTVQRTSH